MTQSHKAFYHQGRIIAALFILSLASAPTMISAQTKTMKIFVKDAEVTIEIYNILGQSVRTLTSQKYPAGKHTVQWNSQNDAGQTVASGVYFARFISGEFVAKKKMVILK